MRTREDLAWAAGFIDGEGGTYCSGPETARAGLLLKAGQAERSTLERMRDSLGLGTVYGPYKTAGLHHRPYWTCSIGGFEKVQAAVAMLWPFLSEPKRQQAHAALYRWKLHRKAARITHCKRGHPFDDENTYVRPGQTGRTCRACVRASQARRRKTNTGSLAVEFRRGNY